MKLLAASCGVSKRNCAVAIPILKWYSVINPPSLWWASDFVKTSSRQVGRFTLPSCQAVAYSEGWSSLQPRWAGSPLRYHKLQGIKAKANKKYETSSIAECPFEKHLITSLENKLQYTICLLYKIDDLVKSPTSALCCILQSFNVR